MSTSRKTILSGAGAVLAAFLGSLCCLGPAVFVTLGIGAGLASAFEPLRPVFGGAMLWSFALAIYGVYGHRSAGRTVGPSCPTAGGGRPGEKALLWVAGLIALVLWMFPAWYERLR